MHASLDSSIPDALVVLGCRVGPGHRVHGAAGRRVARALEAARALEGLPVVVAGGRRWGGVAEADALRAALEAGGLPPGRLHVELLSLTTVENALCAAPLLRALGARRPGVVTCDFHVPRALAAFAQAGFPAAIGLPAGTPPRPPREVALRAALEALRRPVDALAGRAWWGP